MPTAVAGEEHKGGSTLPDSLKNHQGIASEDEPIGLPGLQAFNAKQQKEWVDRNEELLERKEMQAADAGQVNLPVEPEASDKRQPKKKDSCLIF